jgi:hypothetical protein
MIDDDDTTRRDAEIIEARIAGKSVRAIAKARGTSVADINRVIDRFADVVITDKVRKHNLALELERLDELQETFYARALGGDVQSAALVTKIIERRSVMLGLHVPQTSVLKIVDEAKPVETSTDRLERVLNALIEDQRGKGEKPKLRGGGRNRGVLNYRSVRNNAPAAFPIG